MRAAGTEAAPAHDIGLATEFKTAWRPAGTYDAITVPTGGGETLTELDHRRSAMPGPGRNDPCPCGSGRKVKRCCGQRRGPSQDELDRAFVAQHAAAAATELRGISEDRLRRLWDEVDELPELDLSLVVPLPVIHTPELEQLLSAARDDDPDRADEVMPAVLETVDTPRQRAQLAGAIINLRDSGRLGSRQAAIAIIDLDSRSQLLIRASLINAILIHAGRIRTPGGLRLAA